MEVNNRLKGVDVSQQLEKSISAHQLLSYPSEHQSFNRAYEGALQSLNSSALARDLYIVQYKTGDGELGFGYISAASISANGPYYLTDICAVVRKPSAPRLVLQADCTTCGPVCEVERDARLVSQSALDHVERTGHVVVLNGTADIPEW